MTQKRKQWLTVCGVFTLIWFVLGIIIWPLLFLALCSGLMALIPIGVPENAPITVKKPHNPEAWSQRKE